MSILAHDVKIGFLGNLGFLCIGFVLLIAFITLKIGYVKNCFNDGLLLADHGRAEE